MGKRSDFERRERDFYPTPYEAVVPLLPHLGDLHFFDEPCAGDGALVRHLHQHSDLICHTAIDIAPQFNGAGKGDVFDIRGTKANCFITNPPWPAIGQKGDPTVSIAKHLSSLAPTWLILSADFAHNKYFAQLNCVKIVSVGRVSWMGNGDGGKDNCAWYLFDEKNQEQTRFYGRGER